MQACRASPVAALAEALEVSPSGFHAHQRKAQGQRRQEDGELARTITQIFAASRQTYGCPRVTAALRTQGVRCGKNRVARLMREYRLVPRQKRKRWRPVTTDSNHRQPVAENWLAKVPAPDRPDQVWVADITYIDTGEGWLYLAGLLDACTRRLVGWQTGESLDASLVTQAWQKAVRDRRPGSGLLHHSDRGVQYASGAMAALLAKSGAVASMSRRGNCYDNGTMESFRATLKAECFAGERPATRQVAKLLIFDYVEGFYNRTRLHSGLGYQSPLALERNIRYSKTTTIQSAFSRKDHTFGLLPMIAHSRFSSIAEGWADVRLLSPHAEPPSMAAKFTGKFAFRRNFASRKAGRVGTL